MAAPVSCEKSLDFPVYLASIYKTYYSSGYHHFPSNISSQNRRTCQVFEWCRTRQTHEGATGSFPKGLRAPRHCRAAALPLASLCAGLNLCLASSATGGARVRFLLNPAKGISPLWNPFFYRSEGILIFLINTSPTAGRKKGFSRDRCPVGRVR